ncbi:MAG: nuclear transport factor 2 family protein [Dysgonomonas sp.]|nr:nuclear transport factor 2 family protein [Dysgonomonas sp.]
MNKIKDEIIICEDRLLDAMRHGDVQVLDELLHDDLLFNRPTGEVINKEMDLAACKSGDMVAKSITVLDRDIQAFGGDVAIVTVAIAMEAEFRKQPISGNFRFFRTWKKIEGEWKMIGGASVVIQE